MTAAQSQLRISTPGKGLHLITREINEALSAMMGDTTKTASGVLHVFIQHTSASLLIQENADPTARKDLEEFMDRLVPEGEPWYRHLDEGPDDTVSHMKSAVTATSLTIPVRDGRLFLGTWQGVYLWEHRARPHQRTLVLTLLS